MKNLNGKELMRGDVVLHSTPDGVIAGAIHEFYDRSSQIRIGGYPLRVAAEETVLASEAFNAFATPLLAAREAAKTPPSEPVVPPVAPEPTQDTPPVVETPPANV